MKGRREVTSSEGMVSQQCPRKSRITLFEDVSNVGHVVPPVVCHATAHDDVRRTYGFSILLSNSTNKYH